MRILHSTPPPGAHRSPSASIVRRILTVAAFAVAALHGSTPLLAQNPGFVFSNLLDNLHSDFPSIGTPSLAPDGTVVFSGAKSYDEAAGIYVISRGSVTPVTVITPSAQLFYLGPGSGSTNASGTFVFSAALASGGSGIYRTSAPGGPYTTVGLSTSGGLAGAKPSINSAGTVVYAEDIPAGDAVYTVTTDGTRTQVAVEGALFASIGGAAVINDMGAVVFGATLRGNGVTGLFATTATGGTPNTIVDSSGAFDTFVFNPGLSPALRANGDVVFNALLDNGTNGIYLGNIQGGAPVTIADSTGPLKLFGYPAIGALHRRGLHEPLLCRPARGAAPSRLRRSALRWHLRLRSHRKFGVRGRRPSRLSIHAHRRNIGHWPGQPHP